MIWACGKYGIDLSFPRVMAVVNVTPDSFSDGGMYNKPEEAVRRVKNAFAEGAAVVDLGGESTRPGATPLSWEEEWSRLEPVFKALGSDVGPLSVDTYHPETAERAVAAGAAIVNCVYPEPAAAMRLLAEKTGCGLILPVAGTDLATCAPQDGKVRTLVDPEIGFGTTREEDLARLGDLPRLAARAAVCVGVSRKRIIKRLTGERVTGKNLGGCVGAAVWCALKGASVVRVHDVVETVQALAVVRAFGGEVAT